MPTSVKIHANATPIRAQSGFTLIELAIVMVIIGLIVGGLIVGQDIVKASEMRGTLGQIDKYSAAANAFSNKYGALPGDLNAAAAAKFNLTVRSDSMGFHNNNMIIACSGGMFAFSGCESLLFWADLSTTGFIPDYLPGAITGGANDPTAVPIAAGTQNQYFPTSKLYKDTSIIPYWSHYFGYNAFQITNVVSSSAGPPVGAYTLSYGMTTAEAAAMDTKIDDGLPMTGIVHDVEPVIWEIDHPPQFFNVNFCTNTTTTYNTGTATLANTRMCNLEFKM